MAQTSPADQNPPGTGALGLAAFIASLGTLFAGSLAAFWIIRGRADLWSEGLPALPGGLWISTGILLFLSWAAQCALTGLRAGDRPKAVRMLRLAFFFAVGFVLVQGANWQTLIEEQLPPTSSALYAFTFYMLTGLHALHVLGGIIYSFLVYRRINRGGSSGEEEAVSNQATYWHFLGIVWILLFITLLGASAPSLDGSAIKSIFEWCAIVVAVPNLWYWGRTLWALFSRRFLMQGLVSFFPVMAYLFAWMRASELGLEGVALRWFASFAALLFSLSIRLGVMG